MCGIVGVLGDHQAAPILIEGLRRLEYRGYDSAGIATVDNGQLDRRRAVGKLVNLSDLLVMNPLPGKAGIGHTRWATHGAATVTNAHPHRAGKVAVVHNGIIENFAELREALAADGTGFETQTDTETVALLAQKYIDEGMSPLAAADATLERLEGAYALAFLFEGEDDLIVAARKGSPLAIGHGEGEIFVGSDALALGPFTNKFTYLEEGDRAALTRTSVEIRDADGHLANREIHIVDAGGALVEKSGHKHFMAKEISEQPLVLADTLSGYLDRRTNIKFPTDSIDFNNVKQIVMVACGTAYFACLTAKYWFESHAQIPVEVDIASEFRYREPPLREGTLAIFLSQSGETADTLAAMRYAKSKDAKLVAIVNSEFSTIAREADVVLPLYVGPEIGVASTKAFTAMLTVLSALSLEAQGTVNAVDTTKERADLARLPEFMVRALATEPQIKAIARKLSEATDVLFLGRGQMFPIALEGALKLKEISYIHAEGYASGELKHGPIALIEGTVPVIVLAPTDALYDKSISNMQEVLAREGRIILVSDKSGIERAGDGVWATIEMPEVPEFLAPIVYAVPAQLLAYHTAVEKGTDVDQPRNLAKSVTVE